MTARRELEIAEMFSPRQQAKQGLVAEVLRSCGRARLPVNGSSMMPALWPGDLVDVQRAAIEEIEPGAIAVFERDGLIVTHRVTGRFYRGKEVLLLTRGDCSGKYDPPVCAGELLGRVAVIERGARRITPRHSFWNSAGGIVCRSSLCARLLRRLVIGR